MKYFTSFITLMAIALILTSCDKKEASLPSASTLPSTAAGKIVFVNIDSLLSQYQLTKDQKAALEKEADKAEKAFSAKAEAFQKRYVKFQKDIYDIQQKAPNIPPIELKSLEEKFKAQGDQLAKEEQSLNQQRNSANDDLNKKLADVDKHLIESINKYLEKVAAEKGYDFILMKGGGGGVLYGGKSLDVTQPIVDALNEEYKSTKK